MTHRTTLAALTLIALFATAFAAPRKQKSTVGGSNPTNIAIVAVKAPASTTPAIPPTTDPTSTIGIMSAKDDL